MHAMYSGSLVSNLVLLLVFLGASWTSLFDAIEEQVPGEGKAEAILGWCDRHRKGALSCCILHLRTSMP